MKNIKIVVFSIALFLIITSTVVNAHSGNIAGFNNKDTIEILEFDDKFYGYHTENNEKHYHEITWDEANKKWVVVDPNVYYDENINVIKSVGGVLTLIDETNNTEPVPSEDVEEETIQTTQESTQELLEELETASKDAITVDDDVKSAEKLPKNFIVHNEFSTAGKMEIIRSIKWFLLFIIGFRVSKYIKNKI